MSSVAGFESLNPCAKSEAKGSAIQGDYAEDSLLRRLAFRAAVLGCFLSALAGAVATRYPDARVVQGSFSSSLLGE